MEEPWHPRTMSYEIIFLIIINIFQIAKRFNRRLRNRFPLIKDH